MFKAILKTQWQWTRTAVLLAAIAAFTMPLLSMNSNVPTIQPRSFISVMQTWGVGYVVLAATVGLAVAILAWSSDHRGHHVYALALPVARWRYVLLRFGAGVVFLVPVVAALGAGALLAVTMFPIPQGLHTYPWALTARFGFAALVAFAIFFAISSATARTAGYILGAIAGVIVVQFLADAAGLHWDVVSHAVDLVLAYPGVLSVFSGRWALVDV
ncbi:MAG: hypothetical protein KGL38_00030 [Gemmatimonadota bacterium]|nr:hypothetical protein [Gemmatimonadota bacterium]MDE3126356.1 hypothetical protein [Gemmatimonadota bacterium]MDE3214751.1 hypothetical protein [Gemmatimonadota bacterium]